MSAEELAGRVMERLRGRQTSLALAESCTGGMVTALLTRFPGASDWVWGAAVAYQEAAKIGLAGLDSGELRAAGPVSRATTERLATAIRDRSGARCGAAVTGWAGPISLGPDPVGTVYTAVVIDGHLTSRHAVYDGDRGSVREAATRAALTHLLESLEARKGEA